MSQDRLLTTSRPLPSAPLLGRLNRRGFRLVQLADLAGLVAVLVVSMVVPHGLDWPTYAPSRYAASFTVTVALFLVVLYFGGLYEREPRLGAPSVLPRALRLTVAAGAIFALLDLLLSAVARELSWIAPARRLLPLPVPSLLALIVGGAVVIAVTRRVAGALRDRREGPPRLLLVGSEQDVATARAHLGTAPERLQVVGATDRAIGLPEQVAAAEADDIVLLSARALREADEVELEWLEDHGVTILQRITAVETMYGLQRIRELGGLPFVLLRSHRLPRSRARLKRLTDLALLAVFAPVHLPVLGALLLYVLVVAGRPVLFTQERVGAWGVPFRVVKLRTMVRDAEERSGAVLADAEDPRVLPRCRWLRDTRLDELPQLWNVLVGEMSLVGPRPERPELTVGFERSIPGYARRHGVPPGLTGLAQIHGRYRTDAAYKLGYDLQYLVNWSPLLDLEILVRTVWVVLTRRG